MAEYCQHCGGLGGVHKTNLCPGINYPDAAPAAPPKLDLAKLQDTLMELATDLLGLEGLPELLEGLSLGLEEISPKVSTMEPVRFASRAKTVAFQSMVVAIKAAKVAAEDFRKAHIEAQKGGVRAAMEEQLQERLREIDAMNPGDEPKGVS